MYISRAKKIIVVVLGHVDFVSNVCHWGCSRIMHLVNLLLIHHDLLFKIMIEVLFWPKTITMDLHNNQCFTLPLVGATKHPITLLRGEFPCWPLTH